MKKNDLNLFRILNVLKLQELHFQLYYKVEPCEPFGRKFSLLWRTNKHSLGNLPAFIFILGTLFQTYMFLKFVDTSKIYGTSD